MLALIFSLTLGTTAVAAAPSATIVPNPATVTDTSLNANKAHAVDCWSDPGTRGTWLQVFGSTYTTQEAVIYRQILRKLADLKPSILYCFAADGKPGIIAGAPHGLLLPPGTRVDVRPGMEVVIQPPQWPEFQRVTVMRSRSIMTRG